MRHKKTDNLARVTVTLTDESCWITKHDRNGAHALTYPAAITDVCNAFNRFGANTGLLPADTLFWSSIGGVMRIGVWLPPAIRTIHLQVSAKVESLRIPLPGFLFVGMRSEYSIYALAERPTTGRETLCLAPLPNVHDNGVICQGNVEFPAATSDTIAQAVTLFFESLFNADLSGGKLKTGELLPFLRKLSKRHARKFPIGQLVATHDTVSGFIRDGQAQGICRDYPDWPIDDDEDGNVHFDEDVWGNEEDDDA